VKFNADCKSRWGRKIGPILISLGLQKIGNLAKIIIAKKLNRYIVCFTDLS